MKILRVAADLYPSVVGGVGIHVHEMSKEQVNLGHNVTVYTTNVDSSPQDQFVDRYHILRFKSILKLCGNAISPTMFYKLMTARHDFDVIHAHSHLFFTTNLCTLVKILDRSVPLIITSHGLIPSSGPDWLHKLYIPTVGRFVLNSADRVICYTEEEKIRLEEEVGVKSKISVIHNGINTNIFQQKENKKQTDRLLWVGRFTKGKGLDYLIDAFEILSKKYPNLNLLLIGEGPERSHIEQKVSLLGLTDRVSMQKYCPNSKMCDVYNNSDIFVLPSFEEGVPRTILEAMACGIPIVCTKLPHLIDIVKDAGIMVPAKDTDAIADAISEIYINSNLAKQFGINGRNKVVEQYSWADTVLKTTEIYRELL